VVCIISNGRAKIHPRTRALLTLLGVYQARVAKSTVSGKDVLAHLYKVCFTLMLVHFAAFTHHSFSIPHK